MIVWKVSKEQMMALIQEINLLGQKMLKFDEKIFSEYFSSRLAEIVLNMLGLPGNSPEFSVIN